MARHARRTVKPLDSAPQRARSPRDGRLDYAPSPADTPEFSPPEPGNQAPTGPSLFTALQEQLGLRLRSERGTVDSYVIDRAERPEAN